jgi:hypothetical protein
MKTKITERTATYFWTEGEVEVSLRVTQSWPQAESETCKPYVQFHVHIEGSLKPSDETMSKLMSTLDSLQTD